MRMTAKCTLWTLLALFVCLLGSAPMTHAQISPGTLSKAHSFLSGTRNCITCHRIAGVKDFKCLDCHKEIAARISTGRGMHARVVPAGSASKVCSTCHGEHYGEDAPLIVWKPSREQFDHRKTGFALEGHHSELKCNECHNPTHQSAAELVDVRIKDHARTFLGLKTNCGSCHQEPHKGKFGADCRKCHSFDSWRTMPQFDHSKTGFTLVGEHTRVKCEKCHTPTGPENKPRWTGLVFDTCNSCHKSPHPAKFLQNATCTSCHTPIGWKAVSFASVRLKFDHSSTGFALLGKHSNLVCEKCHSGGAFKKPAAFNLCSDCHHPSPHGEQLVHRADKGECGSCHTVQGFETTKFTVNDHASTGFPLQGKHSAVDCAKCHIPKGKETVLRLNFSKCDGCHKDQHDRQFLKPPYMNHCNVCHSVKGFRPSLFTVAQHSTTSYPLEGAHAKLECAACHRKPKSDGSGDLLQFRYDDQTCTACHKDPHQGKFGVSMAKLGEDRKPLGCRTCHSLDSWRDTRNFDHAESGFDLIGKHQIATCKDCHKAPPGYAQAVADVSLKRVYPAPEKCEGCHADVHAGQFADSGSDCGRCHNTFAWKPLIFDHDRDSKYKLEGEHAPVACARCHTEVKTIAEKQVVIYKPTPTQCEACHRGGIRSLSAGS